MLWQIHGTNKQSGLRFSTSGVNTLLTAPTGTNMMVHGLTITPAADVTCVLKCGSRTVADLDLKAFMTFAMDDAPGMDGQGRWECKTGEAFTATLSAAIQCTGMIDYSYVDTTL
jgi:hypothetical protein